MKSSDFEHAQTIEPKDIDKLIVLAEDGRGLSATEKRDLTKVLDTFSSKISLEDRERLKSYLETGSVPLPADTVSPMGALMANLAQGAADVVPSTAGADASASTSAAGATTEVNNDAAPTQPPVRAAIAGGDEYTTVEHLRSRPDVVTHVKKGHVFVAAKKGSIIRVHNRMVEDKDGKPALLSEKRVHPQADNDPATGPFSMREQREEWNAAAQELMRNLGPDEVAVRIDLEGDWKVNDQLMITSVSRDGVVSDPFDVTIASSHPKSEPRAPTARPDRIGIANGMIEGGAYAVTPGAEVRLLLNNGPVASTTADESGKFKLDALVAAPGQTVELAIGSQRLLLAGELKSDVQRSNYAMNKLNDQLAQAPDAQGNLPFELDGLPPGAQLFIRLPQHNAKYEFNADDNGVMSGNLEWVDPGAKIDITFQLTPDASAARRLISAEPEDAKLVEMRSLFPNESERSLASASKVFAPDGPMAAYAGDTQKMREAMLGISLAHATPGKIPSPSNPATRPPSRDPSMTIAPPRSPSSGEMYRYRQEKSRAESHNARAISRMKGALRSAGASEAMMAGFKLVENGSRESGFSGITFDKIDPGHPVPVVVGGNGNGPLEPGFGVAGEVWAFGVPGLDSFLVEGETALPANVNRDAILMRFDIDQRAGTITISD